MSRRLLARQSNGVRCRLFWWHTWRQWPDLPCQQRLQPPHGPHGQQWLAMRFDARTSSSRVRDTRRHEAHFADGFHQPEKPNQLIFLTPSNTRVGHQWEAVEPTNNYTIVHKPPTSSELYIEQEKEPTLERLRELMHEQARRCTTPAARVSEDQFPRRPTTSSSVYRRMQRARLHQPQHRYHLLSPISPS